MRVEFIEGPSWWFGGEEIDLYARSGRLQTWQLCYCIKTERQTGSCTTTRLEAQSLLSGQAKLQVFLG